eukprot:52657-Hanusia_phi.AAC.13
MEAQLEAGRHDGVPPRLPELHRPLLQLLWEHVQHLPPQRQCAARPGLARGGLQGVPQHGGRARHAGPGAATRAPAGGRADGQHGGGELRPGLLRGHLGGVPAQAPLRAGPWQHRALPGPRREPRQRGELQPHGRGRVLPGRRAPSPPPGQLHQFLLQPHAEGHPRHTRQRVEPAGLDTGVPGVDLASHAGDEAQGARLCVSGVITYRFPVIICDI